MDIIDYDHTQKKIKNRDRIKGFIGLWLHMFNPGFSIFYAFYLIHKCG